MCGGSQKAHPGDHRRPGEHLEVYRVLGLAATQSWGVGLPPTSLGLQAPSLLALPSVGEGYL